MIKIRPLVYLEHREDPPPAPFQTVQIGNQIWMAENLQINDGLGGIKDHYSSEFGTQYYYKQSAAVRIASAISETYPGWRLPSKSDFTTLSNYIGSSDASYKLKSTWGWYSGYEGNDQYGFTALPVGNYNSTGTTLQRLKTGTGWWCSDISSGVRYNLIMIEQSNSSLNFTDETDSLGFLFSVRLVRNA